MALNRRVELVDEPLGTTLRRLNVIPPGDARFDGVPVGYRVRCSDQVFAELDRDPVLLQQVSEAAARATNSIARSFITGKNLSTLRVDQAFMQAVKLHFDNGQAQVNAEIKRVLDHHAQMNAAWQSYWKSTTKDLAIAAISVSAGVVGLALAMPTGGVSIGLAVVGLVRGIIGGIAKLVDCYLKAEQIENRLIENTRKLMSAYGIDAGLSQQPDGTLAMSHTVRSGGTTVHAGRTFQIAGAVVNTLTSGPAMATMNLIDADLTKWKGKLASLHQLAHELAIQLNRCLKEIDFIKAQAPPRSQERLAELQNKLIDLLDQGVSKIRFRDAMTISSAYQRYERGWERATKLEAALRDMKTAADSKAGHKGVAIGSALASFVTNAAFTIHNYDGALINNAKLVDAFSWDPSRMKQVGTAAGIGGDFLGVCMDLREIYGAAKGESPEEAAEYAAVEAAFLRAEMPVVPSSPVPLPIPRRQMNAPAPPPRSNPSPPPPNRPPPPRPTVASSTSRPPNRPPPPRPGI